jgi:ABC-type nitrate/sulfonate/bicarbonate transport system substrate-binding protein
MLRSPIAFASLLAVLVAVPARAVDEVAVKPVGVMKRGEAVIVPFIFWGGDVATFHANGGLDTKENSLFGKQGLKLKLTPGDDFDKQVKDYLEGKTPFLRGTMSQLGQVSDQLTAKEETTPVVFLQLTWSAGDHLVGRAEFKNLNDLKGKTIALQKSGPHVGMLNDILRTARLEWKDIKVKWTDDVSGDKGPAELFRKDAKVDACFAITPDMSDLTGGLESAGDGKGKTVKGAHVVVSTAHMSRSIADVYAVRKDFFDKNDVFIEKFAAAYIKGCEDLVAIKRKAGEKWQEGKDGAPYRDIIKQAQDIWGKDPAFKEQVAKADDVDGLISDATFVGLPGNIAFFMRKGNLSGFANKMRMAVALPADPATEKARANPKPLLGPDFNYDTLRRLGDLTGKEIKNARIKAEVKLDPEQTIYNFEVFFKANVTEFPEKEYGQHFERALEAASLFGNAVVAVRGHADPVWLLGGFVEGAQTAKLITKADGANKYKDKDSNIIDLNTRAGVKKAFEIMDKTNFTFTNIYDENRKIEVQKAVKYLDDLSKGRAANVRKAVVGYATTKGLLLEQSQIREQGVGCREPNISFPKDEVENLKNRRVEFSILKVPAKDVTADEFDL